MKKAALLLMSLWVSLGTVWAHCGMEGMHGGGMACPPMGGGHHGGAMAPIFLLLLAFGYWMLRYAEKETSKLLKWVGRAVSWIILLASLGGLLCPFCPRCRQQAAGGGMSCPYGGGMMHHDDDDEAPAAGQPPAAPEKK
jgi:hypothetical protein